MIGIRLLPVDSSSTSATEVWIDDHEFEMWVRAGRVGPATPVWAGALSGGTWRPAEELEIYHLFRSEPEETRQASVSLSDRLMPARGFSAVETLVMVNIVVAGVLLVLWQGNYRYELAGSMRTWHEHVVHVWDLVLTLPTLFLHANAGHLFRNMIALVAAAGAVEVFFGRTRTWLAYLVTGFIGAVFSFYGHARPPLSVGASGAIFGLAGVMTSFLFRFYPRFSERQRWKARRIYAPLFLFLIPPSLFQADYYAHGGGYLMGILLGFMLPLDAHGRKLLEGGRGARPADPEDQEETAPAGDRSPGEEGGASG